MLYRFLSSLTNVGEFEKRSRLKLKFKSCILVILVSYIEYNYLEEFKGLSFSRDLPFLSFLR